MAFSPPMNKGMVVGQSWPFMQASSPPSGARTSYPNYSALYEPSKPLVDAPSSDQIKTNLYPDHVQQMVAALMRGMPPSKYGFSEKG